MKGLLCNVLSGPHNQCGANLAGEPSSQRSGSAGMLPFTCVVLQVMSIIIGLLSENSSISHSPSCKGAYQVAAAVTMVTRQNTPSSEAHQQHLLTALGMTLCNGLPHVQCQVAAAVAAVKRQHTPSCEAHVRCNTASHLPHQEAAPPQIPPCHLRALG